MAIVQLFLKLILVLTLVLGLVEHPFPLLENFLTMFLEIISTLFALLSDSQSLKMSALFHSINLQPSKMYISRLWLIIFFLSFQAPYRWTV